MILAQTRRAMAFVLGLTSLALLTTWALASPLGSTADEDFHLASIWCASGPSEACGSETLNNAEEYSVPATIHGPACFLDRYLESGQDSAACLTEEPEGYELVPTHRLNAIANYYPPYFYRFMNVFVGSDPISSVITMRIVNGFVAVLMFGLAVFLARPWMRRAAVAGVLATLVPFGTFFIPSVNPSGWVVLGVGTFWVFFLSWLTTPRVKSVRSVALLVLSGISLLLASVARSDGALFVGVTALMAMLIGWPQIRPHNKRLLILLVPIPVLIWSFAFRLNAIGGLSGLSFATQTSESGSAGTTALVGDLVRYAFEIPALFAGALGANTPLFNQASVFFYGIGTIDIRMPSIVPLLTMGMAVAIVFTGLRVMNWRKAVALGLGTAVFLAVPLLTVSRFSFQYAYSPRYVYPLAMALVALAFLAKPWRRITLTRTQSGLLGAAFAIANAVALLTTVRRYTNGQAETWLSLGFEPEWWWDFGPSPLAVVGIGSLAGVGVAIGLASLLRDPRLVRT